MPLKNAYARPSSNESTPTVSKAQKNLEPIAAAKRHDVKSSDASQSQVDSPVPSKAKSSPMPPGVNVRPILRKYLRSNDIHARRHGHRQFLRLLSWEGKASTPLDEEIDLLSPNQIFNMHKFCTWNFYSKNSGPARKGWLRRIQLLERAVKVTDDEKMEAVEEQSAPALESILEAYEEEGNNRVMEEAHVPAIKKPLSSSPSPSRSSQSSSPDTSAPTTPPSYVEKESQRPTSERSLRKLLTELRQNHPRSYLPLPIKPPKLSQSISSSASKPISYHPEQATPITPFKPTHRTYRPNKNTDHSKFNTFPSSRRQPSHNTHSKAHLEFIYASRPYSPTMRAKPLVQTNNRGKLVIGEDIRAVLRRLNEDGEGGYAEPFDKGVKRRGSRAGRGFIDEDEVKRMGRGGRREDWGVDLHGEVVGRGCIGEKARKDSGVKVDGVVGVRTRRAETVPFSVLTVPSRAGKESVK